MSNVEFDLLSLEAALQAAVDPMSSFSDLLRRGGWHDIAIVGDDMIAACRSRLSEAARCLESGCGRQLYVRQAGGLLLPARLL